jgi:hypothetical protein
MFTFVKAAIVAMVIGFIPLEQDNSGVWQLDSVPDEMENTHFLMITNGYSPTKGAADRSISGYPDSAECVNNIEERIDYAENVVDYIIDVAVAVYDNNMGLGISVSVCHPEWIIIYAHDGENWAGKEELKKLQEALNVTSPGT